MSMVTRTRTEHRLIWLTRTYDRVCEENGDLVMPLRAGFYKLALNAGVTTEDFDTWAAEREWWKHE